MTSKLHRTLVTAIASVALFSQSYLCLANSEMRDWKLANGDNIRGEIERIDEETKTVKIRMENQTEMEYKTTDFSAIDQAWLIEWIETAEELEQKMTALGGRLEHFQAKGATTVTDFYVYHPSGKPEEGQARPMMIIFDPSGKGRRYLLRHIEAAEAAKITLISCDEFRNKMQGDPQLRFAEMFATIQSVVPHDPARIFLGGTSGGANRAFSFSAKSNAAKWAGIYSNCGWLGGMQNWNLPFPNGMRVAMVNGNNDTGARAWLEPDSMILQKRNIEVSVHAFEGGHQVPPASVQTKAFKWLLKEIE